MFQEHRQFLTTYHGGPTPKRLVAQKLRVRRVLVGNGAIDRPQTSCRWVILGVPAVGIAVAHRGVFARFATAVETKFTRVVDLVGGGHAVVAPTRVRAAIVGQMFFVMKRPHCPDQPTGVGDFGANFVSPRGENTRGRNCTRTTDVLFAPRTRAQRGVVHVVRGQLQHGFFDAVHHVGDNVDVFVVGVGRILVDVATSFLQPHDHGGGIQSPRKVFVHGCGRPLPLLGTVFQRFTGRLVRPTATIHRARPILREVAGELTDGLVFGLLKLGVGVQMNGALSCAHVDIDRLTGGVGEGLPGGGFDQVVPLAFGGGGGGGVEPEWKVMGGETVVGGGIDRGGQGRQEKE